jgi:hypothetical protein
MLVSTLKRKLWFVPRIPRKAIEITVDSTAKLIAPPQSRQAFRNKLRPHRTQRLLNPPTKEKLDSIKNVKKGERCVLVGTAPSINLIDLSRITDEFVFLVNRGYLLRDRFSKEPESITLADPHAFSEYNEHIFQQNWRYIFLSCEISDKQPVKDNEIWFSQWAYPRMDHGFFQFDCQKPLYHAYTVIIPALQIAVWMGFAEIIIVGVDLSFDARKPHFYETIGNELLRSKTSSVTLSRNMQRGFNYAAQYIKQYSSARVYNAGIGGSLECFPRVAWNDLFS